MNVVLTERDRHMLLFLWQNRFVTLRQLRLRFWGGTGGARVTLRLQALQEAGLLKIETNRFVREIRAKDRKVVYITTAGNAELVQSGALTEDLARDTPTRGRQLAADYAPSLIHDLQVVDLRLALGDSLQLTSWTSDHELRLARRQSGWNVRVPDGVFHFRVDGGEVEAVLENERAKYSSKTFAEILDRLRRQYPEALVLVVCASLEHLESMRRWAAAAGVWNDAKDRVLFGHFPAVAEHGAKAPWWTMEGSVDEDHPLKQGAQYAANLE